MDLHMRDGEDADNEMSDAPFSSIAEGADTPSWSVTTPARVQPTSARNRQRRNAISGISGPSQSSRHRGVLTRPAGIAHASSSQRTSRAPPSDQATKDALYVSIAAKRSTLAKSFEAHARGLRLAKEGFERDTSTGQPSGIPGGTLLPHFNSAKSHHEPWLDMKDKHMGEVNMLLDGISELDRRARYTGRGGHRARELQRSIERGMGRGSDASSGGDRGGAGLDAHDGEEKTPSQKEEAFLNTCSSMVERAWDEWTNATKSYVGSNIEPLTKMLQEGTARVKQHKTDLSGLLQIAESSPSEADMRGRWEDFEASLRSLRDQYELIHEHRGLLYAASLSVSPYDSYNQARNERDREQESLRASIEAALPVLQWLSSSRQGAAEATAQPYSGGATDEVLLASLMGNLSTNETGQAQR